MSGIGVQPTGDSDLCNRATSVSSRPAVWVCAGADRDDRQGTARAHPAALLAGAHAVPATDRPIPRSLRNDIVPATCNPSCATSRSAGKAPPSSPRWPPPSSQSACAYPQHGPPVSHRKGPPRRSVDLLPMSSVYSVTYVAGLGRPSLSLKGRGEYLPINRERVPPRRDPACRVFYALAARAGIFRRDRLLRSTE
jgi:hypothetical protein